MKVKLGDRFLTPLNGETWQVIGIKQIKMPTTNAYRARLKRDRDGLRMTARGYRRCAVVAFVLLTIDGESLRGNWVKQ